MEALSLVEKFDKYFELDLAKTEELKRESYKIRHEVFSNELNWTPMSEDKLETDSFDAYSFSLLLKHKPSDLYAGTIRLVIPPNDKPNSQVPFEKYFSDVLLSNVIDHDALPRNSIAEISRLSVPDDFRRRLDENHKPFILNEFNTEMLWSHESRNLPVIAISLILSSIALANLNNVSHTFISMEPRFKKRLAVIGINLTQCSSEIHHNGALAVFYLENMNSPAEFNPEVQKLYQLILRRLQSQMSS